jgi:hypothetical protein
VTLHGKKGLGKKDRKWGCCDKIWYTFKKIGARSQICWQKGKDLNWVMTRFKNFCALHLIHSAIGCTKSTCKSVKVHL